VLAQYLGKIWGWYPGANGSPSGSPEKFKGQLCQLTP
jgi:hypothetical protein